MDWKLGENFASSNKNLKNTIFKSRTYNIEANRHTITLEQYLSETTFGIEIPCYLL